MTDVQVLTATLDEVGRWEALLSAGEKARAADMANPAARSRYIVSRGLRRNLLASCLGRSPSELRFAVSSEGKPFLENAGGWGFNASHAGDLVAVAAARCHVGIDIEALRDVRDAAGIASRYFHADETRAWRELPEPARHEGFFVLWSAREAAMKCAGTGLARGLSVTRIDPSILSEENAVGRVGEVAIQIGRIPAPRGYVLLVARSAAVPAATV